MSGSGESNRDAKKNAYVQCQKLDNWWNEGDGDIEITNSKNRYKVDKIIASAKSKLGEKKFNLYTYNCEHFATWAETGRIKSKHVG